VITVERIVTSNSPNSIICRGEEKSGVQMQYSRAVFTNLSDLLNSLFSKMPKMLPKSKHIIMNTVMELNDHHVKLLDVLPDSFEQGNQVNFRHVRSQIGQDLFALYESKSKRKGFFVEFGATNGIDLSNTYLLEKSFGWEGILAEPAKVWHEALRRNRSAEIETKCVWKDSDSSLVFNETDEPELSTIDAFTSEDMHKETRVNGKTYYVNTISLNDLLEKFNAPRVIDYLSLDTEGSELEILKSFDFTRHEVLVITVEHNYTKFRDEIFSLLTSHGYIRKFEEYSYFDDWYVLAR